MDITDIGKVFVTSDHHFLSWANCPLGFMQAFTEKEEQELIAKWNETVPPDGVVLYAGDFADADTVVQLAEVRKKLNGEIHLAKGNHDTLPVEVYRLVFDSVQDRIDVNRLKVSVAHSDPVDLRQGWTRVFGHYHRGDWTPKLPDGFCCCVQAHGGYPVRLIDVLNAV